MVPTRGSLPLCSNKGGRLGLYLDRISHITYKIVVLANILRWYKPCLTLIYLQYPTDWRWIAIRDLLVPLIAKLFGYGVGSRTPGLDRHLNWSSLPSILPNRWTYDRWSQTVTVDTGYTSQVRTLVVKSYLETIEAILSWTGDAYRIIILSLQPVLGCIESFCAHQDDTSRRREIFKEAWVRINDITSYKKSPIRAERGWTMIVP